MSKPRSLEEIATDCGNKILCNPDGVTEFEAIIMAALREAAEGMRGRCAKKCKAERDRHEKAHSYAHALVAGQCTNEVEALEVG